MRISPQFHHAAHVAGAAALPHRCVLIALAEPPLSLVLTARLGHPTRVFGGSRAQLLAMVRSDPPAVLVLPAEGDDGVPTAGLVAQLRVDEPQVGVVIVTEARLHGRHVRALRLAGARRIATIAQAPHAVAEALGGAGVTELLRDPRLEAALASVHDAALAELLRRAVRQPPGRVSPAVIAGLAGQTYRSFCRHCKRSGWPTPARLTLMVRLLRLSLAPGERLTARAAFAGFGSVRACREALLRFAPEAAHCVTCAPDAVLSRFGVAGQSRP